MKGKRGKQETDDAEKSRICSSDHDPLHSVTGLKRRRQSLRSHHEENFQAFIGEDDVNVDRYEFASKDQLLFNPMTQQTTDFPAASDPTKGSASLQPSATLYETQVQDSFELTRAQLRR